MSLFIQILDWSLVDVQADRTWRDIAMVTDEREEDNAALWIKGITTVTAEHFDENTYVLLANVDFFMLKTPKNFKNTQM